MKKLIKRTLNRPPAGTYPGVIDDWDIVAEPVKGASENEAILVLKFKIVVNKHHITTEKRVLLLWDKGDPMYTLCSQFHVLPEIGEDFDCECFVGRTVEVIVEEEEREGRIYSNIVNLRPLQDPLNAEPAILSEKQGIDQNAVPLVVNGIGEDSEFEAALPSPIVKKIPPTGAISPNRPKKKKIGDVRPKTHPWGNM